MQFIERGPCPLCNCGSTSMHIDFEIPVVKCDKCGFLFSSKVFDEATSASYYGDQFGDHRQMQGQIVNAQINAAALAGLINMRDTHNFLDVGAGYGFLLAELRDKYRIDGTGVELSNIEAVYAKDELKVDMRNCALSEAGLPRNHFDVVSCFEVIEHISQPRDFIRELAGYVKPGGYLVVVTDNFDSRVVRELGAGFPKWIPHEHISHFSPGTLTQLLRSEVDLSICKTKSYTPWEFLARSTYYRLRGITKKPDQVFRLEQELRAEKSGHYKLFTLRRFLNKLWLRLTVAEKMDGAMMFFVARKRVS